MDKNRSLNAKAQVIAEAGAKLGSKVADNGVVSVSAKNLFKSEAMKLQLEAVKRVREASTQKAA